MGVVRALSGQCGVEVKDVDTQHRQHALGTRRRGEGSNWRGLRAVVRGSAKTSVEGVYVDMASTLRVPYSLSGLTVRLLGVCIPLGVVRRRRCGWQCRQMGSKHITRAATGEESIPIIDLPASS